LYDASDATFDDAAEVEAAIANGRVTDPGEMAVNETLLVVVESERLASAMDEHEGSTTERFAAALDGPADLYLVQTNPGTMVTRTFAVVGAENATAYRNGSTVYALVGTGDLVFRKERTNGTHPVDTLYEDRFAVDFGFDLYEPPWEPPGDPPWGPTFVLSNERFVTPTPEPTRTPTDSPTPSQTTAPPETTGPSTPTTVDRTDTEDTATPLETSPSPSATQTGDTATPTVHEDGPGFTAGTTLLAMLSLLLFRRRRE
jgi:PGF-CTERM protein